jgi:hypothetical protein
MRATGADDLVAYTLADDAARDDLDAGPVHLDEQHPPDCVDEPHVGELHPIERSPGTITPDTPELRDPFAPQGSFDSQASHHAPVRGFFYAFGDAHHGQTFRNSRAEVMLAPSSPAARRRRSLVG